MNLNRLTEDEFRDEMQASMFDDEEWAAFLEPDVVERTRTALIDLDGSLAGQLSKWKDEAEPEWKRRTGRLLRRVQTRAAEAKAAIRARNRERTASVQAFEIKWSELAHSLAGALADSDMAFILDELWVPGANPILVSDWLVARAEQRRRKAERFELAEAS